MSHLGAPPSLLVFHCSRPESLGFDPADALPASQPHPDPDPSHPARACARVAASGVSCPTSQSGAVEGRGEKKNKQKQNRSAVKVCEMSRRGWLRVVRPCSFCCVCVWLCVCMCVCVSRVQLVGVAIPTSSNVSLFSFLPSVLFRARITSVQFVDERLPGVFVRMRAELVSFFFFLLRAASM